MLCCAAQEKDRKKMTYKGFGIGKSFGHHTLGLLEDLSNMIGTGSIGLVIGEQMERFLAATLSTARISFREAVDTESTTASRLVQLVQTISVVVIDVVFGDTVNSY